jgi:hypothetical protein
MTIHALHILPPFAIGRLGSADEPVDNYTIEEDPEQPLDFRLITGAETLIVDEYTGEITGSRTPETPSFKDGERIRPVAPFLEVFAQTHTDPQKPLEPLTLDLLDKHGLGVKDIEWRVVLANRKVVRRTGDNNDLVAADSRWFRSHDSQALTGECENFLANTSIAFGHARFIKPNAAYPGIRLRFTPAKGLIYGPKLSEKQQQPPLTEDNEAPIYRVPEERQIYNTRKGTWYRWRAPEQIENNDTDQYKGPFVNETLPPSLFAIEPPAPSWLHNNVAISRGYLDDACDGFVEVRLKQKGGKHLDASARVCAGPPVLVPDSLFVRNLADDLEQIISGPHVPKDEPVEVTRKKAEDIIKRGYETVRFLNVAVMNGNPVQGRPPLSLDTMPAEEAFDTERLERPVMSKDSVDTMAILALHQQVYTALRAGTAPWFYRFLRQPNEAADYSDEGRRKMPAMMCGADNNYLALTHRQIDTIRVAAETPTFAGNLEASTGDAPPAESAPKLTPRNRSAQVNYAALGNPVSSRPINSISNCCPGLEIDFRAVWRRILDGLEMREYDNLIVKDERKSAKPNLSGHRLLRINGVKVMAQKKGPSPADRFDTVILATSDDPDAVQPLEWSNALAHMLHTHSGESVTCEFTKEKSWYDQPWWDDAAPPPHITVKFKVRSFFDGETSVISKVLAQAGELTQGLCSPWQNDYRECSCYYWASARPDYVNVEPSSDGMSQGDNWLQKLRTGQYVPDDYVDSRMILYDDLFWNWEKWLRFQISGKDAFVEPDGTAGTA